MLPRPLPAPIGPGARVGVFALAGPPDPAALERGLSVLEREGLEVVRGANLGRHDGYLAGDDHERVAAFSALLDADCDVLLAARGGYGVMRVLPALPWDRLERFHGWLVGFSDLTALHAAAASRMPVATLHGPMATSLARHPASTARLLSWLRGRQEGRLLRFAATAIVRPGRARGIAAGGNLSILAALVGTPYEPDYTGAVVFLEDVGEPLYRLDRLLTQLSLSSRLSGAKALVAGNLARCGRGEPRWRDRWRALLETAAPPGAVVVEGAGFGHGATNAAIPLGVEVEVDTTAGVVALGGS